MDHRPEPILLSPYCKIPSSEPVKAYVGYPLFDLTNPQTTLVLSSRRDLPIQLISALTGQIGASYPLVNPMTEAYICPNSLEFTLDGNRFIAGSESMISTFDLSRSGQEPISATPTGPHRRNDTTHNPATNMKGIVSALSIDDTSKILAAGTYSRSVGLYESMGDGECVGVFSVKGTSADMEIGGSGITQVSWSPCGRYLYIAERKSDGLLLYDIRKTGQLLAWLTGRDAFTNQRLSFDIIPSFGADGHEIWAGGLDGKVRTWQNPHQSQGSIDPTFGFQSHTGKYICSILPFGRAF